MEPILIIIPAYNAESTIRLLIERIRSALRRFPDTWTIAVVNDGSTDGTVTAVPNDVVVLSHRKNLGKGAALRTGFTYAINNRFAQIVTLDADLQHDPSSIPGLLDFAESHRSDLLIGSRRFDRSSMSWVRIFSNRISSWLIQIKTGYDIPDSQSGFRVIRTLAIQDLEMRSSHFEAESELIVRLAQNRTRIDSYPITTLYGREESHIRPFLDTWRFLKVLLTT